MTFSSKSMILRAYPFLIRSRLQVRNYAAGSAGRSRSYPTRTQPLKSIKLTLNELAQADMPNDVGLFPGTFIMPTGAAKPSIFREPRLRWKLEVLRLKARFDNIRGAITYKFFVRGRPYPKLARREAVATAIALHKRMYTAFAENDVGTLSHICTEGLLASFKARLASNPQNMTQRWTLHRYIKSPRIVSDRASMLQVKEAAVRQVVVKIKSVQSLVKNKRHPQNKEEVIVGDIESGRIINEYLVVQRRIWKGQEERWRIWGTIQEPDVNEILSQ